MRRTIETEVNRAGLSQCGRSKRAAEVTELIETCRAAAPRHTACLRRARPQAPGMFVVEEETAAAIRRAWEEGGEPAGVVELRRRFPLITDNANARRCVRAIVGWGAPRRPAPGQEQG
jgi:hypothetical protein